jgi:hypothetical protein
LGRGGEAIGCVGVVMLMASSGWVVEEVEATELGGLGKLDSESGVLRALMLGRRGRKMTRSMIGLRMAMRLCLPSSFAGPPGLSIEWNGTFAAGVLGVAGMLLKRASAGEGKERVLTLELLRLWIGFRVACIGVLLATGVSSCICWKGKDVTTFSRGLGSGEVMHVSID